MSNKKFDFRSKSTLSVLVLLAAALGITGLLYGRSAKQVQSVSVQSPMVENLTLETEKSTEESTLPTQATGAAAPSEQATTPSAAAELPNQAAVIQDSPALPVIQTTSPVSGSTIGEYAMDCLSYNETTRDWRIHNGIDLAAEDGSPVCAAADGTVYTTYEDDMLGYTVVIQHTGGYTTRYSSLGQDLCVSPGDTVTMGQTIGYASDSALVETVMGAHVHFSVSYQDLPMDPNEFLALN